MRTEDDNLFKCFAQNVPLPLGTSADYGAGANNVTRIEY